MLPCCLTKTDLLFPEDSLYFIQVMFCSYYFLYHHCLPRSFHWVSNSKFTSALKPFSSSPVKMTFFMLQLHFVWFCISFFQNAFLRYNLPTEKCSNSSVSFDKCIYLWNSHFYSYRTFPSLQNVVLSSFPVSLHDISQVNSFWCPSA